MSSHYLKCASHNYWTLAVLLLQAHKAELQQLQSQLDQAYNDLSELQYNTDQEKAALEDKAQAAEEQLKVG